MSDPLLTADDLPFDALSGARLDDTRVVVASYCEQAGVFALTADSIIEDVVAAAERLVELMTEARLDGPRRELARVRMLQHCRAAGVKDARALIDAVLKAKRPTPPPAAPAATLADDEPWPHPVDAGALLTATAALIRRHVVLTAAQAGAVALWIAAAHVIAELSVMPILLITAPTMRAGKTTLLMLLSALVPRPLVASNITGAVLVRLIARYSPTMLLDEADTWLRTDDADMRGVINAGEYRQTAVVYRCAPETHEPQAIPCFAARVLSMIGRPAATIVDRSILIALRRKSRDESIDRMRLDTLREDHAMTRRQWRARGRRDAPGDSRLGGHAGRRHDAGGRAERSRARPLAPVAGDCPPRRRRLARPRRGGRRRARRRRGHGRGDGRSTARHSGRLRGGR